MRNESPDQIVHSLIWVLNFCHSMVFRLSLGKQESHMIRLCLWSGWSDPLLFLKYLSYFADSQVPNQTSQRGVLSLPLQVGKSQFCLCTQWSPKWALADREVSNYPQQTGKSQIILCGQWSPKSSFVDRKVPNHPLQTVKSQSSLCRWGSPKAAFADGAVPNHL